MIVVFGEGLKNPLILSHITWRDDKIQSAYVINGAWEFSRVDGVLCVEGDADSPMEEFQIAIDVPQAYVSDDYNTIIEWAKNEVSE
ncbi:putative phage protein [Aeromonas phage Aes508]|uniref:Putative phage protein n=1 Tax=Aeromonas phage Aes508 TaxID=1198013 RepID=J7KI51_9CAUD|nr:hypothetical protein F484_gp018 [Aeromonas phage Aes508]AFQ97102.1 putative phage protein [Aeromonas phage Aes508]